MAADMPELEAYAEALLQELRQGLDEGCSVASTDRRIAALAVLHHMLDPWQPCRCDFCEFHVKHVGAFPPIP